MGNYDLKKGYQVNEVNQRQVLTSFVISVSASDPHYTPIRFALSSPLVLRFRFRSRSFSYSKNVHSFYTFE